MVAPRFRSVPACEKSRGPEIVDFARSYGMELDEWQSDALDAFSGVDGDSWASPANVMVIARQNGKSEILVARALYGMFVLRKQMILYSSHQWASSNEVFLRMKGIIEQSPELDDQVKHVRLSAAQLGFELHTGERILFLTRSRAAARGFSGDELYFDECHFLSEASHAALRPTLGGRSAEGTVQTFYAASAVDQSRHPDGLVLTRLRQRGIAGEEGIAFVEYSAGIVDDEGAEILPALVPAAVCVDPEVLKRANPGSHTRTINETFGDRDPHTITASEVAEWIAARTGTRKPGTLKQYLTVFRSLLDHAGVEPNPARDPRVKLPKQVRDEANPPPADHFLAILGALLPKWRLFFVTLEQGGLRISEAVTLRWADVDVAGLRLRLPKSATKSDRSRWVYLPDWLLEAIEATCPLEDRVPERRVFQGLQLSAARQAMTRACREAKVPHYSPHDLRHRRITIWHQSGVPARELAERAGHARPSMSLDVYSHVMPPDELASERFLALISV